MFEQDNRAVLLQYSACPPQYGELPALHVDLHEIDGAARDEIIQKSGTNAYVLYGDILGWISASRDAAIGRIGENLVERYLSLRVRHRKLMYICQTFEPAPKAFGISGQGLDGSMTPARSKPDHLPEHDATMCAYVDAVGARFEESTHQLDSQ